MLVLDVAEARHVGSDRTPVVEGRLGADPLRDEPAAARPHGVLAEVGAEQPGRVAHPLRVPRRLRVEQDARGVEATRAEHDHRGLELHHLARVRVDDAHAAGAPGGPVEDHLGDHGIGTDGQVPAVAGRVDEGGRGMEVGVDVAPSSAAAAPEAAGAVLVVQEPVGGDARAAGDVVPAHRRDGPLEGDLDAVELARPLEDAVRHLVEPFLRARAAEEDVHLVVIGLDVVVGDRPVDVVAVHAGRLELLRPVAQRARGPRSSSCRRGRGRGPRNTACPWSGAPSR